MKDFQYFSQVKKFVDREFTKADREDHLEHLQRTVDWVKELKPDADETLLIAAYAHDMDHARRWQDQDSTEDNEEEPREIDFTDRERLERHQEKGAEIIAEFLEEIGVEEQIIEDVRKLVGRHEFGGTERQDVLKDADSLSFLENNVESFLDRAGKTFRKEDVREKFDWMYNRISSDKARDIARPWYQEAVESLENQ